MLNYISRYTPPSPPALKTQHNQRSGDANMLDIIPRLEQCRGLADKLQLAKANGVTGLEYSSRKWRFLRAVRNFIKMPGMTNEWAQMIRSEIGLPKITPPCE